MTDPKRVYVLFNDDGDAEGVFYRKGDAVAEAEHRMTEQNMDTDEWDCYFRIQETTIE